METISSAKRWMRTGRMAAGAYPDRSRLQELVGEPSVSDGFHAWQNQHLVTVHTQAI
ncbi:hypothetical protein [Nonomuraea diastatica]|uniref:hypothetical protein n=1 Tax=Nonomuraea diastatica TaxID=1848329 RepID=UPI001409806B|nr:hypothetical protein [Nonomuraea diastatica]